MFLISNFHAAYSSECDAHVYMSTVPTIAKQCFAVSDVLYDIRGGGPGHRHAYGNFIFRSSGCGVCTIVKGRKCQYLRPWANNKKTKDTLLSQTLKVEEKKVSLVFLFVAQEPRYGHFIF